MIIKQKLAGNIDFDYKWYDIYNCDDHDIRLLKDDFDLTSEIISYITDLHERPHFDHDYITNSDLLVYDVPVWPTADADHFTTLPIKFLMVDHTLFTVHSPDEGRGEGLVGIEEGWMTDAWTSAASTHALCPRKSSS